MKMLKFVKQVPVPPRDWFRRKTIKEEVDFTVDSTSKALVHPRGRLKRRDKKLTPKKQNEK